MRFRLLALFIALTTLFACSKFDKNLLVGKWKIDTMEGISEKDMENMRNIKFEFFPNGRYTFQSTLNLAEAGRYTTVGDLLNTTDTTASSPTEKSVKITKLTTDSLYFLMNNGGKKQNLKFARSK